MPKTTPQKNGIMKLYIAVYENTLKLLSKTMKQYLEQTRKTDYNL